ncbi:tetratricopeptide repeat protein [Clostridium gasigenes]|uniref:tetratricopeptide repeat protein n=1 Tax=Clostridium gasigenes TaxID=94869 RepID=UPI0016238B6A|nr:tetratricopeptide repeat protein [Clostridium gasigenes]MBB6623951.1 tetratricopeptide repeat protein [Clostridium gasigenes]MBU3087503.1 tetratricopeptide repeat protein [Clostridium gasigenes]
MQFIDVFKAKYEQLMEEDIDAGLKYCIDSLEDSENADILVYLGDALMANEDFEEAAQTISRGIELNCTNKVFAYSLKGEALFYLEKYTESRSAFKEVIKNKENSFFAIVYIVDIDIAEGKYLDGINRINIILNSKTLNNKDTAFMETKKGWIMFKYLEKQEEAFLLFKESLNKDRDCGTAYVGLGSYYLYKEEYIEAINSYEKALELDEGYDIVYKGLETAKEKANGKRG